MVATHLSSEAGRTKHLARLGFFYGLGMVVGPSLGGLVTKHFG
jgi:OCT family organic cation transporter-like MFS transporter 18